jgi:hypothetical protein
MNRLLLASIGMFFGSSFVLHLIWEIAQMPLFESQDTSARSVFAMCFFATVTGDMLFMLTIYLTMAIIHKDLCWLTDHRVYSHTATWIVPVVIGILLAISFEMWAVHVVHRWQYSSMPLVPLVQVGVTPVLQMIIIPLATTAFCRWLVMRQSQIRAVDAHT